MVVYAFINLFIVGFGLSMLKGAWLKIGVNYVLDDNTSVRNGIYDFFVALLINLAIWFGTFVFWMVDR